MSEANLLDYLRRTARSDPRVAVGIGDDLAALTWNESHLLLVGADQVLDGVHFDSKVHSPGAIGRKVMNRNLSDCAAMAGQPVAAVATLALPKGCGEQYAIDLIEGIREAGKPFGCTLVGGDTASWIGPLAVTVSIVARSSGIALIKRSGAKPGDKLYVTGPLGGSILGRHMTFEPRIDYAIALSKCCDLHAMLDISDGISRDLKRLCDASAVGAVIYADRIPIHDDARRMNDRRSPLEHALHDGEDHELLFAAASCDHPNAIEIGRIRGELGVYVEINGKTVSLEPLGWDHSL